MTVISVYNTNRGSKADVKGVIVGILISILVHSCWCSVETSDILGFFFPNKRLLLPIIDEFYIDCEKTVFSW